MTRDDYKRLADRLRKYRKMRYMGDCKCGNCQLVPLSLIDELESALRAASVKAGEVVAWVIPDKLYQYADDEENGVVMALDHQSGPFTMPLYAAPTASVGAMRALRQFNVEDYVADYEFRDIDGEAGDHVPTDDERVLITDALHGAIAEIEALAAANQSDGGVEGHATPQTTSATPTRSAEMQGEEHMGATARRTEARDASTKTGPSGIKPGPSGTRIIGTAGEYAIDNRSSFIPRSYLTDDESKSLDEFESLNIVPGPSDPHPAPQALDRVKRVTRLLDQFERDGEIGIAKLAMLRSAVGVIGQRSPAPPEVALADVAAERKRQRELEGWTTDHDDTHISGEMAMAAACYALASILDTEHALNTLVTRYWPWTRKWWKPKSPRVNLVRAGALIIAEIERIDRRALLAKFKMEER